MSAQPEEIRLALLSLIFRATSAGRWESAMAVGALGARVGAGAQLLAMDEAVKNTNAGLISVYMPRDTKGGGGHGCLILVGADDTADARRAVEIGLELTWTDIWAEFMCVRQDIWRCTIRHARARFCPLHLAHHRKCFRHGVCMSRRRRNGYGGYSDKGCGGRRAENSDAGFWNSSHQ